MLGYKNPMNKDYPFYALIEVASNSEKDQANSDRLFSLLADLENVTLVFNVSFIILGWSGALRRESDLSHLEDSRRNRLSLH